jgi:hypothetical protein
MPDSKMQRKKNIRLLAILSILIAATVIVMTMDKNGKRAAFDEKLFSIQDTSQIERIVISAAHFTNELKKVNNDWIVNDKYRLDEGLRRVLLPVLREIRIRRSVSESSREQVVGLLKDQGIRVDVFGRRGLISSFISGGMQEENLTWFMKTDNKQPYVVHLPGYESYVAGLFEITENDWRDRIVMSINWQALNEVKMAYLKEEENSFAIKARGNFFSVPGVNSLDSARVFDFLQDAQYVLTDKYLREGEMPVYDSLSQTQPFAVLSLQTIGQQIPETLAFYPRQNDGRYLLGKMGTGQLALFEYNRVKNLFARMEDFEKHQVSSSEP